MSICCLYRPANGNIKKCIDFLKKMFQRCKSEIWLVGDFNIDFLDRANVGRKKFLSSFNIFGLRQLINEITRPHSKGGTCIDWIVTNSQFLYS